MPCTSRSLHAGSISISRDTSRIGHDPLANGFSPTHTAVFVALTALLVAVAVSGLKRRDLVA